MKKILLILVFVLSSIFIYKYFLQRNFKIEEVTYKDLKGWDEDNHFKALEAFKKSCSNADFLNLNIGKQKSILKDSLRDWKKCCTLAQRGEYSSPKKFFMNNFIPYKIIYKNEEEGKFTGYYKIELEGSLKKEGKYKYPVYKSPMSAELNNYTRKEIEEGVFDNKSLELLWVSDRVRLFFMHIQGSGFINLENGDSVNLGFFSKNNYPYTSIGKVIIEKKYMKKEDLNAFSIIQWLYKNPEKQNEILYSNESYIFFHILKNKATIGSSGAELIPERSIAIDNEFIPYGLPLWLETSFKDKDSEEVKGYNHLMVSQDTGSAIKGGIRGDIFFGTGKDAERKASYQNYKGRYYILLPKFK